MRAGLSIPVSSRAPPGDDGAYALSSRSVRSSDAPRAAEGAGAAPEPVVEAQAGESEFATIVLASLRRRN